MHIYSNLSGIDTYNSSFAFKLDVDYFEALVLSGFANAIKDQIKQNASSVSVILQYQNSDNSKNLTMEIYNKTALRYRDILSFVIIVN